MRRMRLDQGLGELALRAANPAQSYDFQELEYIQVNMGVREEGRLLLCSDIFALGCLWTSKTVLAPEDCICVIPKGLPSDNSQKPKAFTL